jgi:hypothetical protein
VAGKTRSALTDEFWRGYRDSAGLHHDDYDVAAFDLLGRLVLTCARATRLNRNVTLFFRNVTELEMEDSKEAKLSRFGYN